MNASVEYLQNTATVAQIAEHLWICNADFVPPLGGRVDIDEYAEKIAKKAARFEAWSGDTMVGLIAAYCNDKERGIAYITSVSLLKTWMGKGVATQLLSQCVEYAKAYGMHQISLEVAEENTPAIKLYKKSGFSESKVKGPFINMNLYFEGREQLFPLIVQQ